jgi:hypothetical protein
MILRRKKKEGCENVEKRKKGRREWPAVEIHPWEEGMMPNGG